MGAAVLGFIGLGVMGGPMCRNVLAKHGGAVWAFDMNAGALAEAVAAGGLAAADVADESWKAMIPAVADKYRALGERFFFDVARAQNVLFVVNKRADFLSLIPWFCKQCLQVINVGKSKSAIVLQKGEDPFKASSRHASLSIFHGTKNVRRNFGRR